MATDTARRALLRGRLRPAHLPTPPWAIAHNAFTDACTRCGACAERCPQRILSPGDGGFPTVDFSARECTFCGVCVDACPTGALSRQVDPPWTMTARIAVDCLAHQNIYCQSCRDACPTFAVAFTPTLGGVPQPEIDVSACTGCGACVSACPANAIAVLPRGTQ